MYKVMFNNGSSKTISDAKAIYIEDAKKRSMLSVRQKAWLETVKSITYIRSSNPRLNAHLIHMTKDMFDSDCNQCQKKAQEWQEKNSEPLFI